MDRFRHQIKVDFIIRLFVRCLHGYKNGYFHLLFLLLFFFLFRANSSKPLLLYLMREMCHELYEVKKQKKLPIKWMAPEAICEQIFTSKSDVYVLFFDIIQKSITPIQRVQETLKFR